MTSVREKKEAVMKTCLGEIVEKGCVEDTKKGRKKRKKICTKHGIDLEYFAKQWEKHLKGKGRGETAGGVAGTTGATAEARGRATEEKSKSATTRGEGAGEGIDGIFLGLKKRKIETAEKEALEERKKRAKKLAKRKVEDSMKPKRVDEDTGFNVYSAEQLNLNKISGGTPLCPFDCKCCY